MNDMDPVSPPAWLDVPADDLEQLAHEPDLYLGIHQQYQALCEIARLRRLVDRLTLHLEELL